MKGLILFPVIIGVTLVVGGGAVLAYGITQNEKNSQRVTNEYDLDENLENFSLKLETANIELKVGNERKVVCEETEKCYHEVTMSNNTLNIKAIDSRKWHERIFNFGFFTPKVTIYYPAKEFNEFTMESATGDLLIPHDYSFNKLNVKVSTGKVTVNSDVKDSLYVKASTGNMYFTDVNAKSVELKASTGDLYLKNVKVDETIKTNTSTGNVKMDNVNAKNIDVEASTGKATLINTITTEDIKIKTSTGDVKFDSSDAANLNVKTDTGDVRGSILTKKVIFVEQKTGRSRYPKLTEGGRFDITTDTGDIDITIKEVA